MNAFWLKVRSVLKRHVSGLLGVALFLPAAQAVLFFALDPADADRVAAGIGAVWVSILFASVWQIEELLREEWQEGALEVYLVAGAEEQFFWEWVVIGGAGTFVLALLAWASGALIYGLPLLVAPWLPVLLSAIYGWGTAGLVVLVRQIAHGSGMGSFLGPLILFPLVTPLLLAGVQGARSVLLLDLPAGRWMLLGGFFGILYTLLGSWVVPHLLKE